MKYKIILFSFLSGLLFFWACEDSTSDVGMGTLPDQDKIGVYTDTVYLSASTVKLDSIYANTIYGMLGEFYDPTYGNLKSGYLCQFYAPTVKAFSDSIVDGKIDSIFVAVSYSSYLGDSLVPMEASVYPITKALQGNYYTDMSPSDYCDMKTVLGKRGYTARDLTISDSLNKANITSGYSKTLKIRLPDAMGQKFYDDWLKPAPNVYSSPDAFTKYFPGVYVAPTYGSGNILYVEATRILIYYNRLRTTVDTKGNDSTYVALATTTFDVTKEIIQLNSYQSANDDNLLQPSEDKAYVKTPAGIFTKITIPIPEIIKKMGAKKFTNAKFSMSVFGKDEWEYAINYPSSIRDLGVTAKLLLLNTDSVTTFFENKRVADNRTSYTSILGASAAYTYSFGNISAVIQNAITKSPDKNLELLLIPIATKSSGTTDYSTSNYLYPSGITFKKDKDHLKLAIVATDMDVNQLGK